MKKFDRIVAYGCSWTAGDEILDHEILDLTFEECNKLKRKTNLSKWLDEPYLNTTKGKFIYLNRDKNLNASWAAHLAKILNVKFSNRALGGSGIDEHYFRLVRDIHGGNVTKNDLVVIGLTTPDRITFFQDGIMKSRLLSLDFQWKDDIKFRDTLITKYMDDQMLLWNYYKVVSLFNQLNSYGYNIRLQNVRDRQCPVSKNYGWNKGQVEFYVDLVYDETKHLQLLEDKFLTVEIGESLCGFGHPPESSHIRLARQIVESGNL